MSARPGMVSAEEYEAMRTFYGANYAISMDKTANAAEKAGMTRKILEQLLSDES